MRLASALAAHGQGEPVSPLHWRNVAAEPQMVTVGITGVTDPNNNATITIAGVTQDEPTNGLSIFDSAN